MAEEILDQYGRVTVYKEPSHPSPVYHVDGDVPANPYGNLAALLEDDALEELAMDVDRKVDAEQLRASAAMVAELIRAERERGVASENIILGGFSQGGAVAYELALSYPERLGGLFALSTYFATADTIELSEANRKLPIFIGHGRFDPIVADTLGQAALRKLQDLGYEPEYQSYGMEHSLCLEEVRDLDAFLSRLTSGDR
mgnify:CR=1 FL=1